MLVDGIDIIERDRPVRLVTLTQTPRLFLNPQFADDWRIRPDIETRLHAAAKALPDGLCLMVYEAFRSRARQRELWTPVHTRITADNPDLTPEQIYNEAARWVSPPDGFESGHQAGAAVDVTLATTDGKPLDMGCEIDSFTLLTPTAAPVPKPARRNRDLLKDTMQDQGLVNYPDEWWHFCYGDRLWAQITGRTSAFFAPVD